MSASAVKSTHNQLGEFGMQAVRRLAGPGPANVLGLHVRLDRESRGPAFFVYIGEEQRLLIQSTCATAVSDAIQARLSNKIGKQEDPLARMFGLSCHQVVEWLLVRSS